MNKEIDWSKAPKCATHYSPEVINQNACWVIKGDELSKYVTENEFISHGSKSTWLKSTFCDNSLIVRPETKPVYTKEMADTGILPSVGMECLILNMFSAVPNYNKAVIKYMGDLVIYAYVEDGERCDSKINLKFKSLTPPIELIDGKAYKFEFNGFKRLGFYSESRELIVDTSSYWPPDKCTNIQLLEVKS